MRLRSINVYSAFLGNLDITKERTKFLRQESDFLYYEFYKTTKYINNDYCKQLNIECNENISDIIIGKCVSDGYPQIELPFNLDEYNKKTSLEKGMFWVNSIKNILLILMEQYNFEEAKVNEFINYLEEKYSKSNIFEETKDRLIVNS